MAYMGVASLDFAMTNMDNVSDFEMGKSDSCTSSCGDGHRALQEECDDDNLEPGDGCSPDCKIESGWYCLHKPGPVGDDCSTICGDAVLCQASKNVTMERGQRHLEMDVLPRAS